MRTGDAYAVFRGSELALINDPEKVSRLDEILDESEKIRALASITFREMIPENTRLFNHPILETDPQRVSAPFKVFIMPSGVCPYDCITCQDQGGSGLQWDRSTAFEVARQTVAMGVPSVKISCDWSVVHDGDGNYFHDLTAFLRDHGAFPSVSIVGNGITPEVVQQMGSNDTKVSVSLDAGRETSEEIRSGTFDHAYRALEAFAQGGHPAYIGLTFSALNANPGEMGKIVKIAEETGAKGIKVRMVKPLGNAVKNGLMPPIQWFWDGTIERALEVLHDSGLKLDIYNMLNTRGHIDRLNLLHEYDCGTARTMSVRDNGNVIVCVYLPEEFQPRVSIYEKDGSVLTTRTLHEIWQNDPGMIKAGKLPYPDYCGDCELSLIHHGGCYGLARYYQEEHPELGSMHPICFLHKPDLVPSSLLDQVVK